MKSFLKWPGGKASLVGQIFQHLPKPGHFSGYAEPFVGGGSLFFALRDPASPYVAHTRGDDFSLLLADSNPRLIAAYRGIQREPQAVVAHLRQHADRHAEHGKTYYLATRMVSPDHTSPHVPGADARVAAWLIYVNRTCFNGLYRENSRGGFNVPIGSYPPSQVQATLKSPLTSEVITRCSLALQGVRLVCDDFASLCENTTDTGIEPGTLVYMDPPYFPARATSAFTSYTRAKFGQADQERLCALAERLAERGCLVVLSNSDTPETRALYGGRGFRLVEVQATGSISASQRGRGPRLELLILGY